MKYTQPPLLVCCVAPPLEMQSFRDITQQWVLLWQHWGRDGEYWTTRWINSQTHHFKKTRDFFGKDADLYFVIIWFPTTWFQIPKWHSWGCQEERHAIRTRVQQESSIYAIRPRSCLEHPSPSHEWLRRLPIGKKREIPWCWSQTLCHWWVYQCNEQRPRREIEHNVPFCHSWHEVHYPPWCLQ